MIINGLTSLAAIGAVVLAFVLVARESPDARRTRARRRAEARFRRLRVQRQAARPRWAPTLADHADRLRRQAERRAAQAGADARLAELELRHAEALARLAARPVRVTRPGLTRIDSKRLDMSA